ncbi:MAG: hypothetical protein D6696_08420 [Acidobacteria bacterium]|nr:MAG: hypothetical protein D6696_08420 [Acidobacteriota bacterium]
MDEPEPAPPAGEPETGLRLVRLRPTLVRRGTAATLHLEGKGIPDGARVEIRRRGGAVSGIQLRRQKVEGKDRLRISLFIDQTVPLGLYSVVVIDADGQVSNPLSLEVGL